MCIAIIKPKNVELIDEKTLKTCFNNNGHGAGFAFNHANQVLIFKGFMDFKTFLKSFKEMDEKYNLKSKTVFLHFRIATQGGINKEMTHPFPISNDVDTLKATKLRSEYAVIHNGIISIANYDRKISDTALFIQDYLYNISKYKDFFNQKQSIELIENIALSKVAILNGQGEFINTSGFHEVNGVFYSNDSYKERKVIYENKVNSKQYDFEMYNLTVLKNDEVLILEDGEEIRNGDNTTYAIDDTGTAYSCTGYKRGHKNLWYWFGYGDIYNSDFTTVKRKDDTITDNDIVYEMDDFDDGFTMQYNSDWKYF